MNDLPQIPPIRTTLLDPSGGNTTAKEWYYYWGQTGDKLNALVTEGTSANRPNAGDMPDGAIYVDSDQSVIYVNEGGAWHYLAGTMWGPLSPDQRPTDLGANDAGFEYRSIDSSDTYAPRTFVWSGSVWVETTLVLYGTHANRPPADALTPPRTLYVETDRTEVIYQQQANAWHFLAGSMWGTLTPDQRPTDLGANDAGFEYRSTDASDTYAPRTFIWSGTVWIETTLVEYGLHANRPAANAQTPPRTIYVETDRSGVIYQQQANAWHFLAGTMWGPLTPDQRPTDLGANDAGFTFRATDSPARSFVWSGSAWIETTPSQTGIVLLGSASADITLTTSGQPVSGTLLTLSRAGQWLIRGVFYFYLSGTGDSGAYLSGNLLQNGAGGTRQAILTGAPGAGGTVTQQWLFTAAVGNTVQLQAWKTGGTGASVIYASGTSISATWISP